MSACLIHSRDPYIAEIFLESQVKKISPKKVFRYSFKKSKFKEIASKIFNFSLFEGKIIYFLENAEALKGKDIDFLREKIDFNQLNDVYIFQLVSKTYWLKLSLWEGISGLTIKELKFSPLDIKNYLENITEKQLTPQSMQYIIQVYQKSYNFKDVIDASLKTSLLNPESSVIDIKSLRLFLEERDPPEIKYLQQSLKRQDLKHSLETVHSLMEKGYKEEGVLLSLIGRLSKEASFNDAEFILGLERSFKTGRKDASFLLLELLFFYCQREVLQMGIPFK
ncbi:MAG: hypothetical protein P9M06_03740 [Candidatus Saelkia tenebricola]|nr:hypothetical protein [Candidatus Saelkia tenebricola]